MSIHIFILFFILIVHLYRKVISYRKEKGCIPLGKPGFEPGSLRNPNYSRQNNRIQTDWAIEYQAKYFNLIDMTTHTHTHIYMHVYIYIMHTCEECVHMNR